MIARLLPGCLLAVMLCGRAANDPGTTEVCRWQGGKTACFLLMFDDSWPSHWQVAVPELRKRGLTATFYINPGKGEYKHFRHHWEGDGAVWQQGMAYGNHTMTHNGMQDLTDAEWEVGECTRIIRDTVHGGKHHLISWGRPGVKTWNITPEQTAALLEKNLLVDRPTFVDHGVVYHLRTPEQMLALADRAIKSGGMEYLIAHGVERGPEFKMKYQDFWAWKLDCFRPVLDGLAARRDRGDLWITDHISYHQYVTERDKATVTVLAATADSVRLQLTAEVDKELYDCPLTLRTRVPAGWTQCRVTQDDKTATVAVSGGLAQFEATPNRGEISLRPGP